MNYLYSIHRNVVRLSGLCLRHVTITCMVYIMNICIYMSIYICIYIIFIFLQMLNYGSVCSIGTFPQDDMDCYVQY